MNKRTVMFSSIGLIIIVIGAMLVYWYGVLPGIALREEEERKWAETLNVGQSFEPTSLDPGAADTLECYLVGMQMYEGLVRYKVNSIELEGELAESWTVSPDAMTYTFKLRQGIKFHDGTPFNADAVKYSYDRGISFETGFIKGELSALDRIEVVDTYTVRFVMKELDTLFLERMAGYVAKQIMSPTYVQMHEVGGDKGGAWMYDHTCGTGPYEMVLWIPGISVEMKKFDDYWRGWEGPHVTKVLYQWIAETVAQKMMLERGDLDIVEKVELQEIAALNATDDIQVMIVGEGVYPCVMRLDHTEAPFNDTRVREAVAYAMDIDRLSEIAQYYPRIYQILPVSLYGENPTITKRELDLTKAKQLMIDAGYNPEVQHTTIKLWSYTARPEQRRFSEVIAEDLAKIGFNVEINHAVVPVASAARKDPSLFDAFLFTNSGMRVPHPTEYFYRLYHSDNFDTMNIGRWNNTEADAAQDAGLIETDYDKMLAYYFEVDKIISEDVAVVPLVSYPFIVAQRVEVKGRVWNPFFSNYINCYDIWKEK